MRPGAEEEFVAGHRNRGQRVAAVERVEGEFFEVRRCTDDHRFTGLICDVNLPVGQQRGGADRAGDRSGVAARELPSEAGRTAGCKITLMLPSHKTMFFLTPS